MEGAAKLFIWEMGTAALMEKPISEAIAGSWREELAEDSAWAFGNGMAAVLSSIFRGAILICWRYSS